MSIKSELLAATGVTQETGETTQDFLVRVARAATKLPEDEWNALSDEAQSWVNETATEINAARKGGREMNLTPLDAGATPTEDSDMATTTAKPKKAKATKAAKTAEPEPAPKATKTAKPKREKKKVREPKAPKEKQPRELRQNRSYVIRALCLENQLATVETIGELAEAKGHTFDPNTLRGVYQGAMGLIKQATAMGFTIAR